MMGKPEPTIIAVGDVHGELDGLREILRHAGLVDHQDRWIGGDSVLVQTGDMIDRGPKSREAYALLAELQAKAPDAGGQIVRLLGNHELALLQGNFGWVDYPHPEEQQQNIREDVLAGDLRGAFAGQGFLFTHAGVRTEMREHLLQGERLPDDDSVLDVLASRINRLLVEAVRNNRFDDPIFQVGRSRGGPNAVGGIFWEDASKLMGSDRASAIRQVFGHSVHADIAMSGSARRIDLDVHIYRGGRSYLVIRDRRPTPVNALQDSPLPSEQDEPAGRPAPVDTAQGTAAPSDLKLDVKVGLDRESVAFETSVSVNLQIAVTAPKLERPAGRKPLNLAVVLDQSGSMNGQKLAQAQKAVITLIDQLAPWDYFSLVTFDDFTEVIVPAGPVQDKAALRSRVQSIKTRYRGTDLSSGWFQGVTEVKRNAGSSHVSRVLLLTDGQANDGIIDPEILVEQARTFAEEGVELTTLGYGKDFNEDLLQALATAGKGNFYYINSPEHAPTLFLRELKGLLTLAAQNIRVRVCPEAGVRAVRLLGDLPVSQRNGATEVVVGNLPGCEERVLVLALDVGPTSAPGRARLGEVIVEYDVVVGRVRHEVHTLPFEVTRVESPRVAQGRTVLAVTENVLKMRAALARKTAIGRADLADTAGAQRAIQDVRDEFRELAELSPTVRAELDLLEQEQLALTDKARYLEHRKLMSARAYDRMSSKSSMDERRVRPGKNDRDRDDDRNE